MKLQRRITAYHEAAHAVVAFRFGIPIEVVAVCRTGPLSGYVKTTRTPQLVNAISKATSDRALSERAWPQVVRDTERHAMVLLAGAVAEAKLHGTLLRSHCCESDLRRCHALCRALSFYARCLTEGGLMTIRDIDAGAMANGLRRRTAGILNNPIAWRAVTTLAADLEAWGELTGADAADSAQWSRRIRSQLTLLLPIPRETAIETPWRRPDSTMERTPLDPHSIASGRHELVSETTQL